MSRLDLARRVQMDLERLAPQYASVCHEHAALSDCPTVQSLVTRLTDRKKNRSAAAQSERSGMLAAIIGAYQETHDRLWSAILIATFLPMLGTKRLYGADLPEREAIFFAALTEVVDKLDVRKNPDQVHATVWLTAKKALVRKLRQQTAWSGVGFGEDVDVTPDPTTWLSEPLLAAWLLSRGPKGRDAHRRPDIELVVRVEEWGSLKAYVDAVHTPASSAERSRVYKEFYRRHRRAIAQLRDVLGGARARTSLRGSVPPPESETRLRADCTIPETLAPEARVNEVAR